MRKFGLCSLLVMSMAAIGCGGDDTPAVDAAVITPDAPPDIEVDAMIPVGNVEDFGDCVNDEDCMNFPQTECVPIGFLQGTPKTCMPKCNGTNDCPMDTVCYPTGGGNWGPNAALMGDHCWFSLCGEFFGGITGGTGQACTLGADSGVSPADQLPGWCYPFEDGDFGQCLEAGDLPPGSTCDFDFDSRVRGGANCDATGLCIGTTGSATGTCGQICDPRLILQGGADCSAVAGTDCQDSSNISTSATDGSVSRATLGFCTDITACATIGANTCPTDGADLQGCVTTNPLRATGLCDVGGNGALAAGAACSFMGTGDAQECVAGTLCIGDGTTNACRAYCKMPPRTCTTNDQCNPSQTCEMDPITMTMGCVTADYQATPNTVDCSIFGTGFTCQRIGWDDGFDNLPGTGDDNASEDWGACMPMP